MDSFPRNTHVLGILIDKAVLGFVLVTRVHFILQELEGQTRVVTDPCWENNRSSNIGWF